MKHADPLDHVERERERETKRQRESEGDRKKEKEIFPRHCAFLLETNM